MELSEILRFASALIFVVGLIAACAWGARRLGLVQTGGQASPNRRLAVIESLAIDPKRKLMIIRHDDREHVVLLGEQDLILEAGMPARTDLESSEQDPAPMDTNLLSGSVAGQMQKVVSLLKERRA